MLGLCETFLDENVCDSMFKIDGYNMVYKHRNRHGGGVLFYIKDHVKFETIEMNVSHSVESVWVKLNVQSDSIVTGVMYRPPSANSIYYNDMLNQLDYIHSKYDKVILMGDMNYDCCVVGSNPVNNIESLYNMTQLITDPTRVTVTSSTLLDVMLSNVPQLHVMSGVHKISLSDHYMIFSVLSLEKKDSLHKQITFRNFKNFKIDAFVNDLKNSSDVTDTSWSADQLEHKWENFKKAFLEVCNKHAPIQTRRLKKRSNPWFTPDIQKLIYQRDYVKNKAVNLKDPTLWNSYVHLRNKVTQEIRENKRNYAVEKIT
jgi:hypothetical protein